MVQDEVCVELQRKSKTGLSPCPFCGSIELSAIIHKPDNRVICIQCNLCRATGPHDETEETIRTLWDTRCEQQ